jgi:hypothetical protein
VLSARVSLISQSVDGVYASRAGLSLVSICHECEEVLCSEFLARTRHTRVLALGYPQSFVADLGIVGLCFCLSAPKIRRKRYFKYLGSS